MLAILIMNTSLLRARIVRDLILGYNRLVYHRNFFLFIVTIILCTGCGVGVASENGFTTTPDFFTAVLPSTLIPPVTQTSIPPTAVPTLPPIEGTTTTQVNVRAEPSTASESLGMIGAFVKVQVIGKDASGSWYQIIYAGSETGNGWMRAEYAQVTAPAEIPLVETSAGSGSAVSGLVIQKINIRNGPGTGYESLGILNPNDVVFITGKDPSGAWMQIDFASAPDGKGWVAVEFLQATNIETVPLIGNAINETSISSLPSAIVLPAMQDGDSMQVPLATAIFSPTGARTLQVMGDVSAPNGDVEDWVQFSANNDIVSIQVLCSGNTLYAELWNNEKIVDGFSLTCGSERFVTIAPNSNYFLRLSESSADELRYTSYILNVEVVR